MAPRIEKKSLGQQIAEQQDWIAAHGGAADLAALRRLEGARR